ncbi:hypothetical protein ZWY2020_046979 [Hordeum vulgare]|nr:hypothetical protein ZWY2020_046979 [Hordeum vulgare]
MASVPRAAILARAAATDSRFVDVGQLCRVADTVAYAAFPYHIRPAERLLAASDRLMRCDPDKTPDAAEEIRGAAAEVAREAKAAEVQMLAMAALDLERAARVFSEDASKKVGWGWWPWLSSCKKKKKGKGKRKDKSISNGSVTIAALVMNQDLQQQKKLLDAVRDLNDALLAGSSSSTCVEPQPTPKEQNLGVGDYVGYALFGSLALLPYSGLKD